MSLGEGYELRHVRLNSFHPALHSGDGVALALQANTLAHDSSELPIRYPRRPTAVGAMKITAEAENFIVLKFRNKVRREVGTLYSVVCSHCDCKCTTNNVIAVLIRGKGLILSLRCAIFWVGSLFSLIQRYYFKQSRRKYGAGKRAIRMAPIHHY